MGKKRTCLFVGEIGKGFLCFRGCINWEEATMNIGKDSPFIRGSEIMIY